MVSSRPPWATQEDHFKKTKKTNKWTQDISWETQLTLGRCQGRKEDSLHIGYFSKVPRVLVALNPSMNELMVIVYFWFGDTGSCYVTQVNIKLLILLLPHLKCWNYEGVLLHLADI